MKTQSTPDNNDEFILSPSNTSRTVKINSTSFCFPPQHSTLFNPFAREFLNSVFLCVAFKRDNMRRYFLNISYCNTEILSPPTLFTVKKNIEKYIRLNRITHFEFLFFSFGLPLCWKQHKEESSNKKFKESQDEKFKITINDHRIPPETIS